MSTKELKINENNVKKTNTYSTEVSYLSYPSYDTTKAKEIDPFSKIPQPTTSKQSMALKIQTRLFTNPLISISDLLTGNYDPEVINNIERVHQNSDRWFCNNCTLRDDKWGMMKHLCKYNKRKMKKIRTMMVEDTFILHFLERRVKRALRCQFPT